MLNDITPLILTFNEEANIERVLTRLAWAREVVVVDSGSTDTTHALVGRFSNTRLVEHAFESHAGQWNYGLAETGITSEWVLALDADYILSPEFLDELTALAPTKAVNGYRIPFRYCVFGKPLRATLYPPVTALYRRANARYVQDGHTQRVRVSGSVESLKSFILHDDRKPLSRWLDSQVTYARLEADALCTKGWAQLAWPDRLRKLFFVMPPLVFVYSMIVGRGALDGLPGLYYAWQRAVAEIILSLILIERQATGPR